MGFPFERVTRIFQISDISLVRVPRKVLCNHWLSHIHTSPNTPNPISVIDKWQRQTSKLPQQEIRKKKEHVADANVQTTTAGNHKEEKHVADANVQTTSAGNQKDEKIFGRRKRPNYHSRKSERRKNMWQTQTSKLPQQEITKKKKHVADANVQTTSAGNQKVERIFGRRKRPNYHSR